MHSFNVHKFYYMLSFNRKQGFALTKRRELSFYWSSLLLVIYYFSLIYSLSFPKFTASTIILIPCIKTANAIIYPTENIVNTG